MACSMKYFHSLSMNEDEILDFLIKHGVFKETANCIKCNSQLHLHRPTLTFRCQKKASRVAQKMKKKPKKCNTVFSARVGSFFAKPRLELPKYWKLVSTLLHLRPPRQTLLQEELGVSSATVVDWYSFCREVFIDDSLRSSEVLGGEGKVVEIDEATFGKRKYNVGRYIEGQWVFGGVERDSNRSFYVPVANRDRETLLDLIHRWVAPGTTIISDCWKAYANLPNFGPYQHFTVNHSKNFVDPESKEHTNTVERSWREVRSTIPRFGRKPEHFEGYLAEYLFKRKYSRETRLHHFYLAASRLYGGR